MNILSRMLSGLSHLRMLPLVLLFLSILSYGLFVHLLGFYWDDWPAVWVSYSLDASRLREYASYDRPFQGWLFTLTTSLLGVAPLHWHLLALLARWSSGVAVWWSLGGVWPRRTREVACIALLFVVYPGFRYQPSAWIFGQSAIIPLTLSIFSLGAMIWALRVPNLFWPLTALAVPSSAFSLLVTEYFFGLELLRPIFLWLVLSEENTNARQRVRRTLTHWSPYLATTGIYLIWRLLLFKSIRPETDQLAFLSNFAAHPLQDLLRRPFIVFEDFVEASLMAWGQTFRPDTFDYDRLGWGVMLVSAIGVALYLVRLQPNVDSTTSTVTDDRAQWAKQAIIVGLIAMFFGELPVWFGNRFIELDGTYSRYILTAMFGACILLVGLIQIIIKTRLQIMVLSIAVGSAVGFHFRNGQYYHQNWLDQKSLFWQLSWRAPALKPGTSVLMRRIPALAIDDDTLAAPLNFVYAPQHSSPQLNYWFFHLPEEFVTATRDSIQLDIHGLTSDPYLKRTMRNLSFDGLASNSLVIRFSPPSCLRVLDPSRDELPQLHPVERAAISASHVDRIDVRTNSPAHPPTEIMGSEPEHDWCYYFQKADLARQIEDWQQVAQIADQASRRGFKPSDATEWLPFIEAYANLRRYDDARGITRLALEAMPTMRTALLNLLNRLDSSGSPEPARKAFIAEMKTQRWHEKSCINCLHGY